MTPSATVPRSAGNGAALVVVLLSAGISGWQSLAKALTFRRAAA